MKKNKQDNSMQEQLEAIKAYLKPSKQPKHKNKGNKKNGQ